MSASTIARLSGALDEHQQFNRHSVHEQVENQQIEPIEQQLLNKIQLNINEQILKIINLYGNEIYHQHLVQNVKNKNSRSFFLPSDRDRDSESIQSSVTHWS
jgi:hypothetical protein